MPSTTTASAATALGVATAKISSAVTYHVEGVYAIAFVDDAPPAVPIRRSVSDRDGKRRAISKPMPLDRVPPTLHRWR